MGQIHSTVTEILATNEPPAADIKTYCTDVPWIRFYGQTSSIDPLAHKDESNAADAIHNLGFILMTLDKIIRKADPDVFNANDEEFITALNNVALYRHKENKETKEECFERLKTDSIKFEQIFKKRAKASEALSEAHSKYWGSRQQLLFGKVVADWIETSTTTKQKAMDPIFGVLLNPTGGRVGPGDTGWFHNLLYDDTGSFAYHSAVHDGFGYLKSIHNVGPGYDYLDESMLADVNSMAGQISGILFWRRVLVEMEDLRKVYEKV